MTIHVTVRNGEALRVQTGENTAYANLARAGAEAAAVRSEQAVATAESLVGPTYASTAAGLAAVSEGASFAVNVSGAVAIYRKVSGVAVEQRRLATTAALAAGDGGAKVGFTASGSGATAQTVEGKLRQIVSASDYGNPYSDAADSLNKAEDALGPDGGAISLGNSAYYFNATSETSFTKPVQVTGGGRLSSQLASTNGNDFISSTNWIALDNINLTAFGAGVGSGTLFHGLANSDLHSHSRASFCRFEGGDRGLHHEKANQFHIFETEFIGYKFYGALLENINNPDEGDNTVIAAAFMGGTDPSAVGLNARDAGLYMFATKFNGANNIGCLLSALQADTGNFNLHANSHEGHFTAGLRTETAGAFIITKLQVIGSQFSSNSPFQIDLAGTMRNVVLLGNITNRNSADPGTVGVRIGENVSQALIDAGEYHGVETAISLPAAPKTIRVGPLNIFAADVVYPVKGGNYNASSPKALIDPVVTHLKSPTSTSTWIDAISWIGLGVVSIEAATEVVGIGYFSDLKRFVFAGTRAKADGAAVATNNVGALADTVSGIEMQIVATGTGCKLQIRTAGASTGTSANTRLALRFSGILDEIARL